MTHNDQASVSPCPCQDFASIPKILDALESEERTKVLLDWLEGKGDEQALNDQNVIRLSCGKRCRCRFRFGISFAILNSIRDAVRPFLDNQPSGSPSIKSNYVPTKQNGIDNYDESFPSLASSTAPINNSKAALHTHPAANNFLAVPMPTAREITPSNNDRNLKPKKKNKRRIRPQLAGSVSGTTSATWGNKSFGVEDRNSPWAVSAHEITGTATIGSIRGNIANLPSEDPIVLTTEKRKQWTPATSKANTSAAIRPGTGGEKVTQVTENESADMNEHATSQGDLQGKQSTIGVSEDAFRRIVDVYTTLIVHSLVPSTALELHLLLRLLTLTGDLPAQSVENAGEPPAFFILFFASTQSCRSFASMALRKLSSLLTNLGAPLLRGLTQCYPFRSAMPDLAKELDIVMQDRIMAGLRTEYLVNAVTGSHAMMALPFEHDRDSRHHFKSQEEIAMYKNREHIRDSFLYQLRAFIEVRKGSFLLRPQGEVDRALEQIRAESRRVIQTLYRINLAWFAQLFCDLLLQIGLAPMEETDQELLSIAGDKDKLQRLHKRISAKGSHAGRSTKKLVITNQRNDLSKSPVAEAQHLFPGHQEFFFTFLQSTENYSFAIHLSSRLSTVLLELSAESTRSTSEFEKRLLNMQMFARFLGYLVFSPNWHDGVEMDISGSNFVKPPFVGDWIQHLDSLGLHLMKIINSAWQEGHVIMVIPWVTELLKLAKWDTFSQGSRKFREILACLRFIQEQIMLSSDDAAESRFFGPTKQVVSFYLETLFYDFIGFSKLTSFPKASLSLVPSEHRGITNGSTMLDNAVLGFSSITLYASNPHVEELNGLIARISSALGEARSSTKTRKLRPSIVSTSVASSLATSLLNETSRDENLALSPLTKSTTSKVYNDHANKVPSESSSANSKIQAKLADAFFHHHRDIKDICEFAVDRVLGSASKELPNVVKPIFDEVGNTNFLRIDAVVEEVKQKSIAASSTYLSNRLRFGLKGSLEALGPSAIDSKLTDIAVSLATASGMLIGQPIVDSVVSTECKKLRESITQDKQKYHQGSKTPTNDSKFEEMIRAMAKLLENDIESMADKEEILNDLRGLQDKLDSWRLVDVDAISIPTESNIHILFQVLLKMDKFSISMINWCLALEDPLECWLFLSTFLRACSCLAGYSRHGMRCLMNELRTNAKLVPHFVRCGLLAAHSISHQIDLEDLYGLMITSRLVTVDNVRDSLSSNLDDLEVEQRTRLQSLIKHLESSTDLGI